jgi:hypothetical protein
MATNHGEGFRGGGAAPRRSSSERTRHTWQGLLPPRIETRIRRAQPSPVEPPCTRPLHITRYHLHVLAPPVVAPPSRNRKFQIRHCQAEHLYGDAMATVCLATAPCATTSKPTSPPQNPTPATPPPIPAKVEAQSWGRGWRTVFREVGDSCDWLGSCCCHSQRSSPQPEGTCGDFSMSLQGGD